MFFKEVVFIFVVCVIGACSSRHYKVKKQSMGRIVGGVESPIENIPYLVSLLIERERKVYLCGGSLIARETILTAAHCLHDGANNITIRYSSSSYRSGGFLSEVRSFRIHPHFDPVTFNNDVALIYLVRRVILSDRTHTVMLPPKGYQLKDGTPVRVSGWGAISENGPTSNTLREVIVHVVSLEQCKKDYGSKKITGTMLCAGDPEDGKDSCQGDSGGPLVDFYGFQVGIVSFGRGCAKKEYPGIYTNVSAVREFVGTSRYAL